MRHTNKALGDMVEFRRALNEFHDQTLSWREVGLALGKSASYAMRVARGDFNPSQDALSSWSHFITGRAPLFITIEACPDCGSVHACRCHGKQVSEIVALGPGERVVREPAQRRSSRPPRNGRHVWLPADVLLAAETSKGDRTWGEFINDLLEQGE